MKNNNDKEEVRFCNTYSISDFKKIDINSLSRNEDFGNNGFQIIIKSLNIIHSWLKKMLEKTDENKIKYKKNDKDRVYKHVSLFCSFINRIKNLDYETDRQENFSQREKIIKILSKYVYNRKCSDPTIRLYMDINEIKDESKFMELRIKLVNALRYP